ncbi:MAG: alpha/beta hydrolase-fold protein [Anaerolineales bacterium]|jgi:predicted alpha/beta superfamily hydrolase
MINKSKLQPGVEIGELESRLLDRDYLLFIKLPWNYDHEDAEYPVLFCVDGNRSFPFYSTMSLVYETPGTSREDIVVVGIGYKVDEDRISGLADWAAWRTYDLTPERDEGVENFWTKKLSSLTNDDDREVETGGAPIFLHSIHEEIIPFIESNYRISASRRGLAGYSFGGLFTLYALFHEPKMFSNYLAGSPTMWDQLFDYEQDYAIRRDDLETSVFLTAASLEHELVARLERMVELLRSPKYPGLKIDYKIFEGEGHASAYPSFVSNALLSFYGESRTDVK